MWGARIDAVLVGDRLGEQADVAIRLGPAVRHVLGPRPPEPELRPPGFDTRPAAGTCRPRPRRRGRRPHPCPTRGRPRAPPRGSPRSASRPISGPATIGRTGSPRPIPSRRGGCTARPPEAWPRRTTAPLGSVVRRSRAAAQRCAVEDDLAGTRERPDAGRGGDRLAGQSHVAIRTGDRRGGHDLARGQPDADLQRPGPVADVLEPGTDGQGRDGGADRVVVMGLGPAEDREDRVADELLAGPAEPLDGLRPSWPGPPSPGRGPPPGRTPRASGRSRRGRRRAP